MTKGKDREYVRRAIAGGWGVTAEDLATYKAGLDEALQLTRNAKDAREINSCVKTMAVIVGQIQADEHAAIKAETEKAAGGVTNVLVFNITMAEPPRARLEAPAQTA